MRRLASCSLACRSAGRGILPIRGIGNTLPGARSCACCRSRWWCSSSNSTASSSSLGSCFCLRAAVRPSIDCSRCRRRTGQHVASRTSTSAAPFLRPLSSSSTSKFLTTGSSFSNNSRSNSGRIPRARFRRIARRRRGMFPRQMLGLDRPSNSFDRLGASSRISSSSRSSGSTSRVAAAPRRWGGAGFCGGLRHQPAHLLFGHAKTAGQSLQEILLAQPVFHQRVARSRGALAIVHQLLQPAPRRADRTASRCRKWP